MLDYLMGLDPLTVFCGEDDVGQLLRRQRVRQSVGEVGPGRAAKHLRRHRDGQPSKRTHRKQLRR